jgi:hypothetical protein
VLCCFRSKFTKKINKITYKTDKNTNIFVILLVLFVILVIFIVISLLKKQSTQLHSWTDWQATVFLVLNDAVANAVKLKKHRISNESPICSAYWNVDKNVHKLKLCFGSKIIWMWIANKLWQRLNVNVDDPEVAE